MSAKITYCATGYLPEVYFVQQSNIEMISLGSDKPSRQSRITPESRSQGF